jgi:hypothetical protein
MIVVPVETLWSAKYDSSMFHYHSCSSLYCYIIFACLFWAHYKHVGFYSMWSCSHISNINRPWVAPIHHSCTEWDHTITPRTSPWQWQPYWQTKVLQEQQAILHISPTPGHAPLNWQNWPNNTHVNQGQNPNHEPTSMEVQTYDKGFQLSTSLTQLPNLLTSPLQSNLS